MTYHEHGRTTVHQRKQIRHSRAPYRVQAQALGISVATVAKWRRRIDVVDRSSRPQRQTKALPPEAAPPVRLAAEGLVAGSGHRLSGLATDVFSQLS